MASLNKVILLGNLTRDPDLRYTTGGAAVCAFGLAVNRRYTTGSGESREETCLADVELFGRQAETCARFLRKGSPALVEGRLRLDQWDDRQSGRRRSRLLVHGQRVQFVGGPGDDDSGSDNDESPDDARDGGPGGSVEAGPLGLNPY